MTQRLVMSALSAGENINTMDMMDDAIDFCVWVFAPLLSMSFLCFPSLFLWWLSWWGLLILSDLLPLLITQRRSWWWCSHYYVDFAGLDAILVFWSGNQLCHRFGAVKMMSASDVCVNLTVLPGEKNIIHKNQWFHNLGELCAFSQSWSMCLGNPFPQWNTNWTIGPP